MPEPIDLFTGGRDGAFWAVHPAGEGGRLAAHDVYHWSINMDCRSGKAVPANAPIGVAFVGFGVTSSSAPLGAMLEWEDASGNPLLLFAGGSGTGRAIIAQYANNGMASANTQAIDYYTDGVLYRYDQDATADPDEEMAFFCNGSANDILVRRKKDGTIDTGATTTHTMKADHLAIVGSDLWATQGYKMFKLTVNSDPGLAASYSAAGIPVGVPTWKINSVVPLGGAPIVMKPEGVFKYNSETGDFDNVLPVSAHPDNGKNGFVDGRGRVYYPTQDGHIVAITFGYQDSQTPWRFTNIDRNTPYGRITAMAADLDHVYAAVDPGARATQDGLGLTVFAEDGGVFTDETTDVTDRSYASVADVGSLTSGGADFIWVGADEPFLAAHFKLSTPRTSTISLAIPALSTAYGISGGSYQNAGERDSTAILAESGLLTMFGIDVNYDDLVQTGISGNVWEKTTVNSTEKYWMRIQPTGALTGATIREVSIVPYRPPIDKDIVPMTAYVQAGCLPKILVGTWRGEHIVWHDIWALDAPRVEKMMIGRSSHTGGTSERCLYVGAVYQVYAIAIGPDGDPATRPWPKLADYGEAGGADNEHFLMCSAWDFGAPTHWEKIVIEGEHLQEDDEFYYYWRWDHEAEWHKTGPHTPFPTVITNPDPDSKGRVFYHGFALVDGSRDAVAPAVSRIRMVEYETLEDEWGSGLGAPITSPQSH